MSSKIPKNLTSLYTAKLKSSDLTVKDAEALGFTIVENPRKLEEHFYATAAFKIPYKDINGRPTGFYRIRYLETTLKGFAANTNKKVRRYDQPADDMPQLYVPNCLPKGKKWRDILNNPQIPICITEGELKAACATKNGIPTLALGGVWNFKSKKNGLFRLPIFEDILLKDRTVFIIFDSDAATNPQVLFAQYKFAEELFNCGAKPIVITIPKQGEKKHGIDDYIVEFGLQAFKDLITSEDHASEFQFVRELLRLNGEISFVYNPVSLVHFATGQLISRQDAGMMYANSRMFEKKIKPAKNDEDEDEITYKECATFDKWLMWEQRTEVWGISYEPGEAQFVTVEGKQHFNKWEGWGCEPEKGDVSLWKWLLDQVFKNAEPAHRKWFEQWCAYPIQNPGVKMYSCPILFGQLKGTGKTLIGHTLMQIYGVNSQEITDTQLEDDRNVFMAKKQFILGNEVTGSDKRGMVGRLRNLITQLHVTVNAKYEPDYVIRDTINYLLTSNYIDAVYMEDDERRFFVHEVLGPRLIDVDPKKVKAYDSWLKNGDAGKALFYYLLNVDLEGFDPYAPAPDTKSKGVMVEASRSEIESWAFKLKEDPDTCLRHNQSVIPFKLYRLKDIVEIYAPDSHKKPYEKTMTNALRKAGFVKAAGGNSCPTVDGKVNLWVIRDTEKLGNLGTMQIGKLYDDERNFEKATTNAAKKFAPKKGK